MAKSQPSPVRPPSEPRSSLSRADATGALGAYDRPARLQMIAVLLLLLVLVLVPLYLWRRPRSVAEPVAGQATTQPEGGIEAGLTQFAAQPVVGDSAILLGDARVLECHDPGPKRVVECDHIIEFEKGFAQAIEQAKDCVPPASGGGTIAYVADVSFTRKRSPVTVSLPKETRSIRNGKILSACSIAVKRAVYALPIDGLAHAHARYKISITATYAGLK